MDIINAFEETGLFAEVLWDRNVTVGEWRPRDETTVELRSFTKWFIPMDEYFVPSHEHVDVPDAILTSEMGTARLVFRINLDDTGDTFSMGGTVLLYDEAGALTTSFRHRATGQKMTVAAPAATPTP